MTGESDVNRVTRTSRERVCELMWVCESGCHHHRHCHPHLVLCAELGVRIRFSENLCRACPTKMTRKIHRLPAVDRARVWVCSHGHEARALRDQPFGRREHEKRDSCVAVGVLDRHSPRHDLARFSEVLCGGQQRRTTIPQPRSFGS
jgi:hypothetical protein